jgi:signal transduction histidine kinase
MSAAGERAMKLPGWLAEAFLRIREGNLGLQKRIMLYVALGSVAALIFVGFVSNRALMESTRMVHAERLRMASVLAHILADGLMAASDGSLIIIRPGFVYQQLWLHAANPETGTLEFHTALLDQEGNLVMESHPVSPEAAEEHKRLLRGYLDDRTSAVVVHVPTSAPERAHVVALAPLAGLPGGVLVEQGNDLALAVPRSLQQQLVALGALFVLVGLLLSWLTTRQVVTPLTNLTEITRRIAAGDLSTPVPQEGQDEVRALASSFEQMRRQLRESHARLAAANEELERRVQERTRELEHRHADLARATELLEHRQAERTVLLAQTIHAQEEERRRVARELHDSVAQFLSSQVIRLSLLEAQVGAADQQVAAELGALRRQASRAVTEVRRLIVDLRPELLDDMGLEAALGYCAQQILGGTGADVALDVRIGSRLPPRVELVTFRIMQEAITNIGKHAQATAVTISLQCDRAELVGQVADNGIGFDTDGGSVRDGVGLIGMRERAVLLGGTLEISSACGRGTTVAFRFPVGEECWHEGDSGSAG